MNTLDGVIIHQSLAPNKGLGSLGWSLFLPFETWGVELGDDLDV